MADKNIIIGSGFSAHMHHILSSEPYLHYGVTNGNFLFRKKLDRTIEFECNKIFSKKSFSFGKLRLNSKFIKLHDRLIDGGNSKIWGGFFDITNIPKSIINKMKINGILLKRMSLNATGSYSNFPNIFQLQNCNGSIYDFSENRFEIKNSYLNRISIDNNKIILYFYSDVGCDEEQIIYADKAVLAIGTIQLLNVLYNSDYLKDGDNISLEEYKMEYALGPRFTKDSTSIYYTFIRALNHYLGIRKNFNILKFRLIEQKFTIQKNIIHFRIDKNEILPFNNAKFGNSIHYCNLNINNVDINHFLKSLNPNLIGIGMPFVKQLKPGPISNDIVLDIAKKINYL
ncbi:hypothetical protein [Polynucleobacter sp. Nonnen-W13]|uniref:hypothetical protein n=1 Tax=Polynucleobacter sp. Nonnen-W13 TaxID=1855625 RepID=UPI001C0B3012|nr:hypothetical protein [Polynucleobacter sp. Nonnen-W13]MBU3558367.1 hypothetical protein [Polynucleobacter sp. Nonnen-W13]